MSGRSRGWLEKLMTFRRCSCIVFIFTRMSRRLLIEKVKICSFMLSAAFHTVYECFRCLALVVRPNFLALCALFTSWARPKNILKKIVRLSSCTTRMGAMGKDPHHASMNLRAVTCAASPKTEQRSKDRWNDTSKGGVHQIRCDSRHADWPGHVSYCSEASKSGSAVIFPRWNRVAPIEYRIAYLVTCWGYGSVGSEVEARRRGGWDWWGLMVCLAIPHGDQAYSCGMNAYSLELFRCFIDSFWCECSIGLPFGCVDLISDLKYLPQAPCPSDCRVNLSAMIPQHMVIGDLEGSLCFVSWGIRCPRCVK